MALQLSISVETSGRHPSGCQQRLKIMGGHVLASFGGKLVMVSLR